MFEILRKLALPLILLTGFYTTTNAQNIGATSVTLAADPTLPSQAATKRYVDAHASSGLPGVIVTGSGASQQVAFPGIVAATNVVVTGTPGFSGAPGTIPDLTGTGKGGLFFNSATNQPCYEYNSAVCTTLALVVPVYQAQDLFAGTTGALVTAHTDANGHAWTNYNGNTGNDLSASTLDGSGHAISISGTSIMAGEYLNSVTPSSANYVVGATFTQLNTSNPGAILYLRAASSGYTVYQCNYTYSSGVMLYRVVAGSAVAVVGPIAGNWTTGTPMTMTCGASGSTITLAVNGVTKISYTDVTPISTVGQGGFGVSGAGGMNATNFTIQ